MPFWVEMILGSMGTVRETFVSLRKDLSEGGCPRACRHPVLAVGLPEGKTMRDAKPIWSSVPWYEAFAAIIGRR